MASRSAGSMKLRFAGGHGVAQTGLKVDRARLPGDLRLRLEPHALGRPVQPLPRRFGGVTHGAAAKHDVMHPVEPLGLREPQRGAGGLLRFIGAEHRRGGKPHHQDEQQGGGQPGPGRIALPGVNRVEIMPDRHAHEKDERRDDPVVLAREGQRIVVGQHHEDDRQRQVVVVGRPLLGDLAVFRIRHPSGDEIRHHDPLVRHDDEEDVGAHHRRGKGAQMQQRGAARKHVGVEIGHPDENDVERQHQAGVVLSEPRLAEDIVDHPAKGERGKRYQYRNRPGNVGDGGVHQVELRPEVVDEAEQSEAREPGGVAFPFEPDKVVGHPFGRDEVFLDMIETAAMHLPFLAVRTRGEVAVPVQSQVQRDEIEGGSDPGDRRDDVDPPDRELQPGAHGGKIVHLFSPVPVPQLYPGAREGPLRPANPCTGAIRPHLDC